MRPITFIFLCLLSVLGWCEGYGPEQPRPKRELPSGDLEPKSHGEVFAASGVVLLSRVPVDAFPGAQSGVQDIWGYVSPSGREYALVGLKSGVAFVEVTDPTLPVILDVIPHTESCCSDVKVFGDYAYIVAEGGGGLRTVDLSQIDSGIVTIADTFTDMGLNKAHNIAINDASGFLYICGASDNVSNGGLLIFDLSAPASPAFAGEWSDLRVHDAFVLTYSEGTYAGKEIAFVFTGSNKPGFVILDVTDKSDIQTLGSTDYAFQTFTHQGWPDESGKFIFVNDEFDELNRARPTTTYVINVSDLTNPRPSGSFTTGLPSTDHNLTVRGEFVFEANYASGLRIFQVLPPNFAHPLGFFDTYPLNDNKGFMGAWGVYADLPSGNILVTDIQHGLFILDPSEALALAGPVPAVDWRGSIVLVLLLTLTGAAALVSVNRTRRS